MKLNQDVNRVSCKQDIIEDWEITVSAGLTVKPTVVDTGDQMGTQDFILPHDLKLSDFF